MYNRYLPKRQKRQQHTSARLYTAVDTCLVFRHILKEKLDCELFVVGKGRAKLVIIILTMFFIIKGIIMMVLLVVCMAIMLR